MGQGFTCEELVCLGLHHRSLDPSNLVSFPVCVALNRMLTLNSVRSEWRPLGNCGQSHCLLFLVGGQEI